MSFGFQCFELDGVTVQNIGASGTPAFVRELPPDLAPLGGSRAYFQGVREGVAPYASTTTLRPALVVGLTGDEFVPVNFFENAQAPAPTVTLNAVGEIASLMPVGPLLLAPGVGDAVRVTYTGGTYIDVQGTVATVSAALSASAGAGAVVGPLSCVYVERPAPAGRGNDATGQRGNAARPFATLQAAFAAMSDGDELRIASGSFAASPVPVPVGLVSGTISGVLGATIIDATGLPASSCLDLSGAKRGVWVAKGVQFNAPDPGTFAVKADGSAVAAQNFFVNGALAFDRCTLIGDALFSYVGNLFFVSCSAPQAAVMSFTTCGRVTHESSFFPGGTQMFFTANQADPLSPTFPLALGPLYFDGGCSFFDPGVLTLSGSPRLEAAPGSILPTVMGSGLVNSGSGPGFQLQVNGRVTTLDFVAPGGAIPDGPRTLDIRGATVIETAQFELQAGSLSRCLVMAGGASFLAGSSVILAGDGVEVRCEGASFFDILTNVATVGSGTIRPSTFALPTTAVGGLAVPFVLPFALPSDQYVVSLDADDATTLPLAVTARTATGFTAAVTVATGNLRATVTPFGA